MQKNYIFFSCKNFIFTLYARTLVHLRYKFGINWIEIDHLLDKKKKAGTTKKGKLIKRQKLR